MNDTAYRSPNGGKIHTRECATVKHYLGGGDKRGASPDLTALPMAEALAHIAKYDFAECGNCRRTRRSHTADGRKATLLPGHTHTWVVPLSERHIWVITTDGRDISEVDTTRMPGIGQHPWHVSADLIRWYANEYDTRAEGSHMAGWHLTYTHDHIGPIRTRALALQQVEVGLSSDYDAMYAAPKPVEAPEPQSEAFAPYGLAHDVSTGQTFPATQAQREHAWHLGGTAPVFPIDKDGKPIAEYDVTSPWLQPVRRVWVG